MIFNLFILKFESLNKWSFSFCEFYNENMKSKGKWPTALLHLELKKKKLHYEFLYSNSW
jgi:hypothetical protein